MAVRFGLPFVQWINGNSVVEAGARLYFYTTGTSTPKNTYSDKDLTTPNTNPVVADSNGKFGNIFLSPGLYNVALKDSGDVTIWTADPIGDSFESVDVTGSFALSGTISPAQITANQNNYNPTGGSSASTWRLNSDAARDITGVAGGSTGRILILQNVGGFAITLKDENGSSTAANRLAMTGDIILQPDQCAILQYDSTVSRWRVIAGATDPLANINSLTEDITPDPANDFVVTYDTSAGAAKKARPSNISVAGVGFLKLSGSASGGGKTASWTADEVVAAASLGGSAYKGGSKTFSFNGANTGANGMDTGSTPTSGDLYVYAIYNPTTQTWACLGTISGSGANIYGGANMPSGYVASALIWAGRTDGSGNLVSFTQRDRKIWRTKTFVLTGGTQTSFTSISLSSAVPVCAVSVSGNAGVDSTTTNLGVSVAADSNGIAEHVMTAATAGGFNFANFSGAVPFTDLPIMTSQTMYYKVTSGGSCRVEINGYSF